MALQIIQLVLSFLSLPAIGLILTDFYKGWKSNTAKAKAARKKESQDVIREVISEEIKPLKEDIANLKETDELQRSGLQAVLRDRLYRLNKDCVGKGYTTQEDRDNFENMYDKYHTLGANGVMDVTHDKFFELPYEEEYNKLHV